jgi:hypothetical protein
LSVPAAIAFDVADASRLRIARILIAYPATGPGATSLAAPERALDLAPLAVPLSTPRLQLFAARLQLFAARLLLFATASSRFRGGRKIFLSTPEFFLSTLIPPLFLLTACLLFAARPRSGHGGTFADLAAQTLEVVGADAVSTSQRDLMNQGKKG